MAGKNKDQLIRELETLAESVHRLKQERRQRRPIVIEFSGSPKSGKTSCINSLQLFLKRNGFSVEIVQERASVCPVSNKHSPMFNLWTSCALLSGMIGVLGKSNPNCDVLILDRGPFDAISWFHWLHNARAIESSQRDIIEKQ